MSVDYAWMTFNAMLNNTLCLLEALAGVELCVLQRSGLRNVGRKIDKSQCSAALRCHISKGGGVHLFTTIVQLVHRYQCSSPEALPGGNMNDDFREFAKAARIDQGDPSLSEEVHR